MDQPQRANAAQMAARNIKMAKGKHPRRPGFAQKDNSSTQSWATPSSETGLFGGNIQAAGTFNFASPSALKFDTASFGTMPHQKIDGLQSNIGGGFNHNNQSATTLFGAGAAPANQSASQTSSGFPAGQMMPSFGSGEMEKAPNNPGFSFQGGFQAGSFGGTTSVSAPVAPISHTVPSTATNTITTTTTAAAATAAATAAAAATSNSTNSASTPIFSFGSTSQPAAKPKSIFGSSGGITFDINNQASSQGSSQHSSQGSSQGPLQTASNSTFGFQTQVSQNQPLTAEKSSGVPGFGSLQNPLGSSGVLGSITTSVESTNNLFGRQGSQDIGNESNLKNLATTSANSTNLFGAPQGTPTQGSNLKQNLFGPGLASNTFMITQTSQSNSLSKGVLSQRDNIQSGELNNGAFTLSDQPTSGTELFYPQTSAISQFSHSIVNEEFSNVTSKSLSPKVLYESNKPESTEIEMEISDNLEVRNMNLIDSPTQSAKNALIESNSLESMGKNINSHDGLQKPTFSVQLQMPGKDDISQPLTHSKIGPQENIILSDMRVEKKDLKNESALYQTSADQCGIKAIGNEKYNDSAVQPLSSKLSINAEMELPSNIFGQVNISSLSSKSTNESPTQSTQTSFLSQNSMNATSSEAHCVSGSENTTVSTTETGSSKALSKISSSQDSKTRNKYAPKVLPRNPLFRNLALTSQIKDEEIIASLPVGCSNIEREQFFALYRLRALNQAMGKLFLGLPITSDPQIVLKFYTEERHNILSNCTSLDRKPKRRLSYGESDNYLSRKKRA